MSDCAIMLLVVFSLAGSPKQRFKPAANLCPEGTAPQSVGVGTIIWVHPGGYYDDGVPAEAWGRRDCRFGTSVIRYPSARL
ncbi:hypothetical protein EYF80_028843 [Liparis tanakae]|uniref:Uncharacterized protein n=1 Tax=Liparis tanakae TaxID=230148 RepID=A0A4Z2H7I4_9TELE|nr:hypothetical protein EYF80_028843 [Liparis tanakae]